MNRSEILQKLSTGEINVDEATRLLEGLKAQPDVEPEKPQAQESQEARESKEAQPQALASTPKNTGQPKWLHIRVSDVGSDKDRVRVNIPIGVFRASKWFGGRFNYKFGLWDEVIDALDQGETGTLVEVEDIESGERVHIYVD